MQTFFFDISNLVKGIFIFLNIVGDQLGVGTKGFGEHYLGFHSKLMKNS
jgi:hypothetical protein